MKKLITFILLAFCISSLLYGCGDSKTVYWDEKSEEEYASFIGEKTEELKNAVALMHDIFESEKGTVQKQIQKNDTYKTALDTALSWLENINHYTAIPVYAADLHTYLVSYGQSSVAFITSVPACCETSDAMTISDTIAILNADYDNIQTELEYVSVMSTPSLDVSLDELSGKWRTEDGDVFIFGKDSLHLGEEKYTGTYDTGRFTSDNMTLIITEKNKNNFTASLIVNKEILNISAKLIENAEMTIGTVLRDMKGYQLIFDGAYYASHLIPSHAQITSGYTYYENSQEDSQYFIAEFTLKNTDAEKLEKNISKDMIFNVSYMDTLNYDATLIFENVDGSGFVGKPNLLTASTCKVYARFTVPNTVISENCTISVLFGNHNYIYEHIPEVPDAEITEEITENDSDAAL